MLKQNNSLRNNKKAIQRKNDIVVTNLEKRIEYRDKVIKEKDMIIAEKEKENKLL